MRTISVEEAAVRLPQLVREATQGEEIVLSEGQEPQVRLVPVKPPQGRPRRGSAKDLIVYMADDFDTPLEDFREYME